MRSLKYCLLALALNVAYVWLHVFHIQNTIADYQFEKTAHYDEIFLEQFENLHREYMEDGAELSDELEDKINRLYGYNVEFYVAADVLGDIPDLKPTEYSMEDEGIVYWRVKPDTIALIHIDSLPMWMMMLSEFVLAAVLFLINGSLMVLCYCRYERQHLNLIDNYKLSTGNHAENLRDVIVALIEDEKQRSALIDQQIQNHKDLLHGVAHEFRSPLARMEFALEMLSQDTPEQNELKQTLEQNINELNDLIAELLSFSRLAHRGSYERNDNIELSALIERVKDNLKTIYPKLAFINEVDHSLRLVANERLIERALINVLRNAGRYARSECRVSCEHDGRGFTLIIEDDGPGIPPGKRERVFEPFTRLDPSRSRDSGGSGLGLAIVKSIAELHGGDVHIGESDLGGVKLTMFLPNEV
ncbi:ATP-binding protein [Pseudoteredinibacter isoporae]|uniref:histidine kinase n=1 Tax=Pseudoteredinibacter isoporae TaxID=570281 RepID=A0A7X0JQQ7_9GAMM|nr:ATP-binding protein [Pseudoteredinibacter isoporae]MBB6520049.1 signal transduction histidine kinase [Pseudoteredinibacter isoporae]NHO85621.1 hypothetical protein [Pseudoteredinibacter isoporae]NIB25927.1 hypothetical protein [Pseudoteredinibacter isoporae]